MKMTKALTTPLTNNPPPTIPPTANPTPPILEFPAVIAPITSGAPLARAKNVTPANC